MTDSPKSIIAERTRQFEQAIREGYNKYSIVDRAATLTIIDEREAKDRDESFTQFGLGYRIEKTWFNREDIIAQPFFFDMGKAIALGEETFLVNNVFEMTKSELSEGEGILDETVDLTIDRIAGNLWTRDFRPTVLFAPVEYMAAIATNDRLRFRVEDHRDYVVDKLDHTIEVLWSSNYVRFKDFVLIDKHQFAEWIVKVDPDRNRLRVSIEERQGYFAVTARTVAAFRQRNRYAGARARGERPELKSVG